LKAVKDNQVTADIGGKLGTTEAGSYISKNITGDQETRSQGGKSDG
jgi:hypothetical protein